MRVDEGPAAGAGSGKNFKPLSEGERAALLSKTAAAAKNGEFELYKTSTQFDGTTHNPQWLG